MNCSFPIRRPPHKPQTNKQNYANSREEKTNKHSDGPRQRDYNLQEANCNNYSQIGLGHKVSKEWNTIEPKKHCNV